MTDSAATSAPPPPAAEPVPAAAYISLGLLLLVSTFALLDKAIVAYLLEPIKHEFALSDSELGLISGLAFAVSFALVGLPLGVAADRTNRRNLVAVCLGVWSLMTAAGGLAQNFMQLVLSRFGVGAGEAGCGPGVLSILADIFPARKRATAMAVYALATPLGAIIAYMVAAQLLPIYGWRGVLFACGAPAILLVPMLLLFVPEPHRGGDAGRGDTTEAPGLLDTARFVMSQRALVHLMIGITWTSMTMNGLGMWIMSFFVRIHHVDFATVGPILAFAFPVPALIGTFASGVLADRMARRSERWRVWIPAIGALACTAVSCVLLLTDDWALTLAMWGLYGFTSVIWYGPGYALAVTLVGVRMRASLIAILFLLTNLVGYGLSPLLVGALSDLFASFAGDRSLRFAMLVAALFNILAALHFFLAGRTLVRDIARAQK